MMGEAMPLVAPCHYDPLGQQKLTCWPNQVDKLSRTRNIVKKLHKKAVNLEFFHAWRRFMANAVQ